MATPPTRVSYNVPATGNYSTATSPKTTNTFNVTVGDIIVVLASCENAASLVSVTPTASGGSVTWTSRATQTGGVSTQSAAYCWTGVVGSTATGITVSLARPTSNTGLLWGMSATVYTAHGGVGVVFSGNNGTASGAPSVAATCSANSAVVCQINDWNAADGTSRTWRTVNSSAESESVYFRDAAVHAVYGGYRADTGAAGSITQGLTAPSTMRYVLVGVEILGTAGGSNAGTLSATLPKVTGSIAGDSTNPGATAGALPKVTAAIVGTATNPGTISGTLPVVTGILSGTSTNPGTTVATLPKVTGSLAGTATNSGVLAATLPKVVGSLADTATVIGNIAANLPAVTGSITGTSTNPGTLNGTLPKIAGVVTGTSTNPGSLVGTLPPVTGSIAGISVNVGTLVATLPKVIGNLSDTPTNPGTLVAILPKLVGSIVGTSRNPATLAATLPNVTATLTGSAVNTGTLVAVLPKVRGDIRNPSADRNITVIAASIPDRGDGATVPRPYDASIPVGPTATTRRRWSSP